MRILRVKNTEEAGGKSLKAAIVSAAGVAMILTLEPQQKENISLQDGHVLVIATDETDLAKLTLKDKASSAPRKKSGGGKKQPAKKSGSSKTPKAKTPKAKTPKAKKPKTGKSKKEK
ncbi:MAG: hypothetical protein WBK55_08175 [Alphaproteobacteria bacterium]